MPEVKLKKSESNYRYYWRLWHHSRDDSDIVFLRSLCDPGRTNLLEIGCGDGRIALSLQSDCSSVTGIDLDDELLEEARIQANARKSRNINFVEMNATQLQFDSEQFDRVVFPWSLHMVDRPFQAVREAFRVLRSKGLLIVIGLRSDGLYDKIIGEFTEAPTIDPLLAYENPICETFGVSAFRLKEERSFPYYFQDERTAADAFRFALEFWYSRVLNQDEYHRLLTMLSSSNANERVRIDFPANIYIAEKT